MVKNVYISMEFYEALMTPKGSGPIKTLLSQLFKGIIFYIIWRGYRFSKKGSHLNGVLWSFDGPSGVSANQNTIVTTIQRNNILFNLKGIWIAKKGSHLNGVLWSFDGPSGVSANQNTFVTTIPRYNILFKLKGIWISKKG